MNPLSELFSDPGFALAFRASTPAPRTPRALLVLLHGVGGNESNLANLAAGAPADTLVLLPRGPIVLGTGQFGWFRVAFTANGPQIEAAEAESSRIALTEFVAQQQIAHGISPEHTVIAGFSQGGILSASVALATPERVRAFAILAGRILPELQPAIAARERLSRLQAFVGHGLADSKLPVSWAQRAQAQLESLGVAHALKLYPGDHGIAPQMAADFHAWLEPLLGAPQAPLVLEMGDEATVLRTQNAGDAAHRVAPGIGRVAREYFARGTSALAMENAIAAIEDEIALVPESLRGRSVTSSSLQVKAIAEAAGAGLSKQITREAVENVFARLSAVALGRPAATEGLPPDQKFAAALVVLRELMHHLDIAAIDFAPTQQSR